MRPFIILSLPRSRSFWLSKFLSYGPYYCGHDELRYARSMDDIKNWFKQPYTGTCETSAASWWRLLPHYASDAKIITIRRPVNEVLSSLEKLGFQMTSELIKNIEIMNSKLSQLEKRLPDVKSFQFSDLENEKTCEYLFEYCLDMKHDSERYQKLSEMNLQINMTALMRYYNAYQESMNKLAKQAKSLSISLMQPKDIDHDDGVILQEETLEQFIKDGKELFAEHSLDVGESPDSYLEKNIPLMETLEKLGYLTIHTARCNGRIFGYLMTIISPTIERRDALSGVHTLFYTSKEIKNLGMKLQRASIESMKKKGVTEVMLRAGVRGSTAGRISTLYKRMGAEDFGHLYRLDLST